MLQHVTLHVCIHIHSGTVEQLLQAALDSTCFDAVQWVIRHQDPLVPLWPTHMLEAGLRCNSIRVIQHMVDIVQRTRETRDRTQQIDVLDTMLHVDQGYI